jgi:phosphoglycolate phosphatase-like HAD superfamily hydrolase
LIRAVIFDLDGTLIQLPIDYDQLLEKFATITGTTNLHPLNQMISALDQKKRRQVFRIWDEAELLALKRATAKETGMALYRKYSPKPKALITMQGKALTETIMEKLGLSFDFAVTREESLDRISQLRIASERLGTSSEHILFVGNTDEDCSAAEEVHCQFQRVS